jgi:hypothetical protein
MFQLELLEDLSTMTGSILVGCAITKELLDIPRTVVATLDI